MTPLHRLRLSLALLAAVVACGTLGYVLIAGYPLLDAFYMTVITLTTVGHGEVHPLSPPGRIFSIGLIAVGPGTGAPVIGGAIPIAFWEHFGVALGRQRRGRLLADERAHLIT